MDFIINMLTIILMLVAATITVIPCLAIIILLLEKWKWLSESNVFVSVGTIMTIVIVYVSIVGAVAYELGIKVEF